MTKANSQRSTSKHSPPASPKRLTIDDLAAAIDAVHAEGTETDDWPDGLTAMEYAKAKGYSQQKARSMMNRLVDRDVMERKTVLRLNIAGKLNKTYIYRLKK